MRQLYYGDTFDGPWIEITGIVGWTEYEPPRPLEKTVELPVINGPMRYQEIGPYGTEISFQIAITSASTFQTFLANLNKCWMFIDSDGKTYKGIIPLDKFSATKAPGVWFISVVFRTETRVVGA